jgi:hypothetical protein
MNHNKFVRTFWNTMEEYERSKKIREETYLYDDIINNNEHPLNVLEKLIYLWPPCDIRIDVNPNFLVSVESNKNSDTDMLEDIVRSAEYITTKKDFTNNILEISINIIKNLDEIERYNRAVREHNEKWLNSGKPNKIFDPVHGEEFDLEDKYVDPVLINGNILEAPEIEQNISYGPLTKARPQVKRKRLVRIVYQLTVNKDKSFTLGYIAYNYNNEILYYNTIAHTNLGYLIRRSVQEMWGLPFKSGTYIEGVSFFLTGKKIDICIKDNKKPSFIIKEEKEIKLKDDNKCIQAEKRISFLSKAILYTPVLAVIFNLIAIPVYVVGSLYYPNFFLFLSLINVPVLCLVRAILLVWNREVSVLYAERHFL